LLVKPSKKWHFFEIFLMTERNEMSKNNEFRIIAFLYLIGGVIASFPLEGLDAPVWLWLGFYVVWMAGGLIIGNLKRYR
jgi:hypothetical protein